VIDEAQEYQDDQEQALIYVVTDSKNPQTIMTGTPPTVSSSGTVFSQYRIAVLAGERAHNGWAEWSVDHLSDPKDKAIWYETNPSMGIILTERAVADEIRDDDLDFNIQRLGHWVKYSLRSAISDAEWAELALSTKPKPEGKITIGIKYDHGGESVSMALAVKHENKILVESLGRKETRQGNAWLVTFLLAAGDAVSKIIIDGQSGQAVLEGELREEKIRNIVLPTVKQIITANSAFESAIHAGTICHTNQASLAQAAGNCEKRAIGSGGGFGYKPIISDIDVSILDAVILAHYGAVYFPQKKDRQQVSIA
jgi:phage terminase large subunit-like protein